MEMRAEIYDGAALWRALETKMRVLNLILQEMAN